MSNMTSPSSGLTQLTRVAWALIAVDVSGVRSLHLVKRNHRGKLGYFSKSARGVSDKIGFGEVN